MTDAHRAKAEQLDAQDPLKEFRAEFHIPGAPNGGDSIYLCGNSLGLQSKRSTALVAAEMDKWARLGVEGHFREDRPWAWIDETVTSHLAEIVGASPDEVVCMNSLTVNLHLLMLAFYRPSGKRNKIVVETNAFCSDSHVFKSQLKFHGIDPKDGLVEVSGKDGSSTIFVEDLEAVLNELGDTVALVLFSGVQFYTGQFFELDKIAACARRSGALVGFDLAHAVGNVPLKLHEWGADFAVWCSYKYLNGGPGCIGGAFVHSKHSGSTELHRLDGWWGQKPETRFSMQGTHDPLLGAQSFQMSNPAVLPVVSLLGSLEHFKLAGQDRLREKSLQLTSFLEELVVDRLQDNVSIITPTDPTLRGCQLSLFFDKVSVSTVHKYISDRGVICDVREPDVMRIAPVPLYNSFMDVYNFVELLVLAIKSALSSTQ